ncbi:MAG: hypothetical protein EPO00_05575 [Chloroflexota bacterium]|nr:MAG: hypothetical protein EPO00_05575 [Chloroflexota bacterium]
MKGPSVTKRRIVANVLIASAIAVTLVGIGLISKNRDALTAQATGSPGVPTDSTSVPTPSLTATASGSPLETPSSTSSAGEPTSPPETTKPGRTPGPTPPPTPKPAAWPAIGHIYTIVMENEEATSIIGSAKAPYINSLAATYGLAANFTAVAHPSEPNYVAMFSGSTQGVTDDATHTFTKVANLADQIEASGRDWHVAAQNVKLECFAGTSSSGGADGAGTYVRKHEPAIMFSQIASNPGRCAKITDFTHFDPNLGNYWFIAPNLCNDMHDCPIATGDAFLRSFLPTILDSAAFRKDGLIFLTFDEGSSKKGGGGEVVTVVISPKGKAGYVSNVAYNHYSVLRTIETLWKMPCLANACKAAPMRDMFR